MPDAGDMGPSTEETPKPDLSNELLNQDDNSLLGIFTRFDNLASCGNLLASFSQLTVA